MNTIEIKPGQTLIITTDTNVVEGVTYAKVMSISYDNLRSLLIDKKHGVKPQSKKSKTQGANISRLIGLSCWAIETGRWRTGSQIDRSQVARDLVEKLKNLPESEARNVTDKAINALQSLLDSQRKNRTLGIGPTIQLKLILEGIKDSQMI